MINKRLPELSCNKKNLIKPSHCKRKPNQKAITKHHSSLKSLNITPREIDCVQWYSLIPHSAKKIKTNIGKTLLMLVKQYFPNTANWIKYLIRTPSRWVTAAWKTCPVLLSNTA